MPTLPYDTSDDEERNRNNNNHSVDAAATLAAASLLDDRNASANADTDFTFRQVSPTPTSTLTPFFPSGQLQFRSRTIIAPSPPPAESSSGTSTPLQASDKSRYQPSSLSDSCAPLRILTDINPSTPVRGRSLVIERPSTLQHKTSASSLRPISRTPSLKTGSLASALGTASTASSTVASPIITAMGDMTPLPSPLLAGDSPGPWKKMRSPRSPEAVPALATLSPHDVFATCTGESISSALGHQKQRKAYSGLASSRGPVEGASTQQEDKGHLQQTHARNRSISEYTPDPLHIPKRMATVTGTHMRVDTGRVELPFEAHLRREPHLSEARGLTPIEKPPTPPPSESSMSVTDSSSVNGSASGISMKKSRHEHFEAYGRYDQKLRRWRAIKTLGQGTFSRVVLATSQVPSSASDDEDGSANHGMLTPEPPAQYDRRTLVAVKICEHGPRGGASEDRVEMSLKRELEIMQSIDHPSLVHLKAWNIEPSRAILVLSYSPGGDLFDVASIYREFLSPTLLRRIFAELVGAVTYLHERRIVHRDVKLENVLVNLPPYELDSKTDWTTYPYPVVTLTDLGLSRRVADDERLETRCGSDDYAAPEVIMGQAYDGRAIDAWSLGVLLYALLESRLPFDPAPGIGDQAMQMRMRSRTSHRIARVEWRWYEYGVQDGANGDGDHEADVKRFKAKGLHGAREVVENLLKRSRSRWPLTRIAETEWVRGGIAVPGGIKFWEEKEGEEVVL